MIQVKFSLDEEHLHFLEKYKKYGFKDKSAVIRSALERMQQELEREKLRMSADAYAELYDENQELRDLTESAIDAWPV